MNTISLTLADEQRFCPRSSLKELDREHPRGRIFWTPATSMSIVFEHYKPHTRRRAVFLNIVSLTIADGRLQLMNEKHQRPRICLSVCIVSLRLTCYYEFLRCYVGPTWWLLWWTYIFMRGPMLSIASQEPCKCGLMEARLASCALQLPSRQRR